MFRGAWTGSRGICGGARLGGLISVFEEFSAIVDKAFILAGGLGDELSFIGVQEIS